MTSHVGLWKEDMVGLATHHIGVARHNKCSAVTQPDEICEQVWQFDLMVDVSLISQSVLSC